MGVFCIAHSHLILELSKHSIKQPQKKIKSFYLFFCFFVSWVCYPFN